MSCRCPTGCGNAPSVDDANRACVVCMTGRLHLEDLDFIASAPEGDARASADRAAERYDHFRDLWLRSAGAGAERAMFEDVAGELRPGGDVLDADLARDIAIGAGTDVAAETADNMLMCSDPLDVAVAIAISLGTVPEMRQKPRLGGGLQLAHAAHRRWRVRAARIRAAAEVGAISMSSSGVTVALNAVARKRLHLPRGS